MPGKSVVELGMLRLRREGRFRSPPCCALHDSAATTAYSTTAYSTISPPIRSAMRVTL